MKEFIKVKKLRAKVHAALLAAMKDIYEEPIREEIAGREDWDEFALRALNIEFRRLSALRLARRPRKTKESK